MREAAVVLNLDLEPIYWHTPNDRSTVSLPDSNALWQVLWDNKDDLYGVAHTHPGYGIPTPSHTDLTTFSAIDCGIGRRLRWHIFTQSACILCVHTGPGKLDYGTTRVGMGSPWVPKLLHLSTL